MRKKIGDMNIPFSEIYNEEDDVYYVTFKTGEPSYCYEIDDVLALELGLFTNLPTGFRMLNFKKQKIASIEIAALFKKVKNTMDKIDIPRLNDRETQVKKALKEVLC
ncbi:hypothetical protein KJ766_02460 [Patescibacteria group bacterium]|nr:hypothetical protein [Patescibacteria group bacterium]